MQCVDLGGRRIIKKGFVRSCAGARVFVVLRCPVLIVFFKQKTAYEM